MSADGEDDAHVTEQYLLAPNATDLEKALAAASGSGLSAIPLDVSRVSRLALSDELDAQLAPFLPWMAWSLSVDIWSERWTAQMQHESVRQAIDRHRHRGTVRGAKDAIRRVLAEAIYRGRGHFRDLHELDNAYVLREWWDTHENAEPGAPMTFEVTLWAGRSYQSGMGLTAELYEKLRRAIDAAKPMSSRYRLVAGGVDLELEAPPSMSLKVAQLARFRATVHDPDID